MGSKYASGSSPTILGIFSNRQNSYFNKLQLEDSVTSVLLKISQNF